MSPSDCLGHASLVPVHVGTIHCLLAVRRDCGPPSQSRWAFPSCRVRAATHTRTHVMAVWRGILEVGRRGHALAYRTGRVLIAAPQGCGCMPCSCRWGIAQQAIATLHMPPPVQNACFLIHGTTGCPVAWGTCKRSPFCMCFVCVVFGGRELNVRDALTGWVTCSSRQSRRGSSRVLVPCDTQSHCSAPL